MELHKYSLHVTGTSLFVTEQITYVSQRNVCCFKMDSHTSTEIVTDKTET